jgi:hypothetical protein
MRLDDIGKVLSIPRGALARWSRFGVLRSVYCPKVRWLVELVRAHERVGPVLLRAAIQKAAPQIAAQDYTEAEKVIFAARGVDR